MQKFVSRKLLLTLLAILLVAGSDLLGLGLDDESLSAIVTMVLGMVGAQGLVDTAQAIKTGHKASDAVSDVKEAITDDE